jgi:hypothetical protein
VGVTPPVRHANQANTESNRISVFWLWCDSVLAMVPHMGLIDAATWGVLGGLAAALISLSGDVMSAGFKWPWRGNETFWPRMFVVGVGVILGGMVSAAAHAQMSGVWPAFIMGASAPSVVRSVLSKVAVAEGKKEPTLPEGVTNHGD